MQAFILPSPSPKSCYPLTLLRTVSELPAANQPLHTLQKKNIEAAGLQPIADEGDLQQPAIYIPGDAYITPPDLQNLAKQNSYTVLEDKGGQPLAWAGDSRQIPEGADRITVQTGLRILYPWDLLKLNEMLVGAFDHDEISGNLSDTVRIEGNAIIGEGTRLLPGVFIEGNVIIGRDCKIGPNCYIRGKTSIGNNCHVGQAVEIKNSILMDNVSAGHLSYCGDTIIADGANLGAGTITANLRHDNADHRSQVNGELIETGRRKLGAIIGAGVHTGIHTSIYPGRKLWPGTSTRPGEIIQEDHISGFSRFSVKF